MIIPREMKKAANTSQTIGSAKPPSAVLMGSAPLIAVANTPNSTIAPPGSGWVIMPATVPTKIASSRHDSGVTDSGMGHNKMTAGGTMTASQRSHIRLPECAAALGFSGSWATSKCCLP